MLSRPCAEPSIAVQPILVGKTVYFSCLLIVSTGGYLVGADLPGDMVSLRGLIEEVAGVLFDLNLDYDVTWLAIGCLAGVTESYLGVVFDAGGDFDPESLTPSGQVFLHSLSRLFSGEGYFVVGVATGLALCLTKYLF